MSQPSPSSSSSPWPSSGYSDASASIDAQRRPLMALVSGLSSIVVAVFALIKTLLAFATVTIPSACFSVVHYSLTLQLGFPSLLLLFLAAVVGALFWLRYRHRSYERLKEQPLKTDDGFNLHPELNQEERDQKQGPFHTYLDDFLQAIRIFGFLEKPVFHELARHLQTRRLLAGDSLSLDSDSSFYIVIDGKVQVFAPLADQQGTETSEALLDDDDHPGLQLLNEVESGGTLSSLFTILSLFTEDVHLGFAADSPPHANGPGPWQHPPPPQHDDWNGLRRRASAMPPGSEQLQLSAATLRHVPSASRPLAAAGSSFEGLAPLDSGEAAANLDDSSFPSPDGRTRSSSPIPPNILPPAQATATSLLGSPVRTRGVRRPSDALGRSDSSPAMPQHMRSNSMGRSAAAAAQSARSQRPQPHHDHEPIGTIGRATMDTTLAVIPAEAFKRLTKKFPNSAAHIVQVILTRLSRVTFRTSHQYLGLTKEIMRTEKRINEVARFQLPPSFYEQGGIEKLRQRFLPEPRRQASRSRGDASEDGGYFRHRDTDHDGVPTVTSRSQPPTTPWGHPDPPLRTPHARTSVGPGDLLSMTGNNDLPRGSSNDRPNLHLSPKKMTAAQREESSLSDAAALERNTLKDDILDCMSKAIGLTAMQPPSPPASNTNTFDASPFLHPQDSGRRAAAFNSAFGSLSMLDGMMFDDEASSLTGSIAGPHYAELENEVEVRFFSAGSTLVKAGDSQAGLFYVIDGFLDVVVPPPQHGNGTAAAKADAGKQSHSSSPLKRRAEPQRGPQRTMSKLAEAKAKSGAQGGAAKATGAESADATAPAPAATPTPKPIFTVGRGGVAGYLSSLLSSPSFVDIQAKTDVYVGYLPAKALERIMENRPSTVLTLSKRLLTLLSPLILHIDSALDWQQVNAGHVIFREGDSSDSFYIVINGRLRAISDTDGAVEVLGEYGQGDSVGELDVITSSPRQKTLHAIRDSELVRMPMTLFNAVAVRHPQIAIQISRIIGRRVRQEVENRQAAANTLRTQIPGLPDLGRNNANLKTVAILPVTREVPIVDFANKLQAAFEDTIGAPTAFLNQSSVMSVLGRHAFNRMGKLKLAGWLSEQEQRYRLVLYVVDTVVSSPWAQTSIRQADSVLLVGFGDDPAVGEYERLLLSIKTTARKELVLLHPERSVPPGSTREWLKSRPWINAHHHVEMAGITLSHATPMTADPGAVQALRHLKEKLETSLQRYRVKGGARGVAGGGGGRGHQFSDFARLARRLCGKSIGLVLGGGGARGCAHVGVVQALEERGIPIDMIGGTSIGSLIGGLYAKEGEVVSSYGRAKKFSGRMGSLWRFASDLTYPVVSYTTGHEFNRGIFKALADTHIEDMWLPFFCNTTNITWSRMEVHTTGYAWRYIRGSMTLAGLIPPLVDEGNMLVDGGYVDNLPVSVMLAMGARSVFAVDVGSIDDTSPRSYGDTLSGWWVLLNKWNPWSDARNIPSIPDIQGRLTYVSSVKTLEEAKRLKNVFYMRMPVEGFGTLEFGAFNEISRIGYDAGSKMLDDWAAEGKLPGGAGGGSGGVGGGDGDGIAGKDGARDRKGKMGGVSARRNSV